MSEPAIVAALPDGPTFATPIQTGLFGFRLPQFFDYCTRRYGETFTTRLPDRVMVHFTNPAAIRELFSASFEDVHAGDSNAVVLEPFVGTNSLLLLDGARHLKERKLMLPPFHGERMKTYIRVMTEATQADMARWPVGETFALRPHTQSITLDVILRAVFGADDPERMAELRTQLDRVLLASGSPILLVPAFRHDLGPLSPWGRFLSQRDDVDRVLLAWIRHRRHDPGVADRDDILSLLVQARYEDGGALHDHDLRDELITLLLAGHETTATALSWAFDLLLHHPAVLDRLTAELRLGDETYLDAVIKETLRIRPVIPLVGRRLMRPMRLGGYDLPEGIIAVANIFLTHRRADIYPDPLAFKPERFIDSPADTYTWIPFGGGTRRCLGAAFATTEMRVVLRTVLTQARLRAGSPRMENVGRRAVTLVPKRGTLVVLDKPPSSRPAEPVPVLAEAAPAHSR
jgi:cytochrome P450